MGNRLHDSCSENFIPDVIKCIMAVVAAHSSEGERKNVAKLWREAAAAENIYTRQQPKDRHNPSLTSRNLM